MTAPEGEVGVPGDATAYYLAATVDELPTSGPNMYAVYEIGDQMCVYRDAAWWCSPTAVVREALTL